MTEPSVVILQMADKVYLGFSEFRIVSELFQKFVRFIVVDAAVGASVYSSVYEHLKIDAFGQLRKHDHLAHYTLSVFFVS